MPRYSLRISPFIVAACLALVPLCVRASDDVTVTLRGSQASMLRQNGIAKKESYSFLRTSAQIRRFVSEGQLERVAGSEDYDVIASHPYARPAVQSFIDRLSSDYRSACGEKLVITSLTRPTSQQPRNASPLSVHPTGMAVDLRISRRASCSSWLKTELLRLEGLGVLDATQEHSPPHLHIAVFPSQYVAYDVGLTADSLLADRLERLDAEIAQHTPIAPAVVRIEPLRPSVLQRIAALVTFVVLPIFG
jgi:hypothetical protein